MPGFALVVNNKNEILLIQRGYGRAKGKWSMPGGRRDRGENLKRTAIRETREETGVKTSADSLYLKGRRNNFEVWRGRHLGGSLRPQEGECLDAKWFQMDMLPHDDNLAFGLDKIVIKKWADENAGSRRVHYPRSKMGRAGFLLVVSPADEVLLRCRRSGRRVDKWGLPGGKPSSGQSRRDAAVCETQRVTGMNVAVERFYCAPLFEPMEDAPRSQTVCRAGLQIAQGVQAARAALLPGAGEDHSPLPNVAGGVQCDRTLRVAQRTEPPVDGAQGGVRLSLRIQTRLVSVFRCVQAISAL